MNYDELRGDILHDMKKLENLKNHILRNNKSEDFQIQVNGMLGVELESPATDVDVPWIRLNYAECYLYIHDDGTFWYQLDPMHGCGAEIINVKTYDEFVKAVEELTDEVIDKNYVEWW